MFLTRSRLSIVSIIYYSLCVITLFVLRVYKSAFHYLFISVYIRTDVYSTSICIIFMWWNKHIERIRGVSDKFHLVSRTYFLISYSNVLINLTGMYRRPHVRINMKFSCTRWTDRNSPLKRGRGANRAISLQRDSVRRLLAGTARYHYHLLNSRQEIFGDV